MFVNTDSVLQSAVYHKADADDSVFLFPWDLAMIISWLVGIKFLSKNKKNELL